MAKSSERESPREEDKRRRIVQAAEALFSRYGYKRTSVELLAAEAKLAKPTIYAYFDDKESIFRAVCESVCDQLLAAAEEASRIDAPIERRLAAVLSAKFTRLWELVHSSPHSAELLDSQGSLGAEIVARADRAYQKLLVRVIDEAARARSLSPERAGLTSKEAAAVLLRAASGAAYDATSAANHERHLVEIVRLVALGMKA
jgi:AcrR family transcriptional regulator